MYERRSVSRINNSFIFSDLTKDDQRERERMTDMTKLNDLIQQANLLRGVLKCNWFVCQSCLKLSIGVAIECQAYKDYKEHLCGKCALFCSPCMEYYAPSGDYFHAECKEGVYEGDEEEEVESTN